METERRRTIQDAYNKEHGITPKTIVKAIGDGLEISMSEENKRMRQHRMSRAERQQTIERLTKEMKEAARLLQFELAAQMRDEFSGWNAERIPPPPTPVNARPLPKHARAGGNIKIEYNTRKKACKAQLQNQNRPETTALSSRVRGSIT